MKLRKLQYIYINVRKLLNIQTLHMIYFAKTQSILQYSISAWGELGIVASNKILKSQKSIVKIIISKPKTYSSAQLYKKM